MSLFKEFNSSQLRDSPQFCNLSKGGEERLIALLLLLTYVELKIEMESKSKLLRARGRAATVWEDMSSGKLLLQDSGISACGFGFFLVAKGRPLTSLKIQFNWFSRIAQLQACGFSVRVHSVCVCLPELGGRKNPITIKNAYFWLI